MSAEGNAVAPEDYPRRSSCSCTRFAGSEGASLAPSDPGHVPHHRRRWVQRVQGVQRGERGAVWGRHESVHRIVANASMSVNATFERERTRMVMNEPRTRLGRVTFETVALGLPRVEARVETLARTTATREKDPGAHRGTRDARGGYRARGALGDMSALANSRPRARPPSRWRCARDAVNPIPEEVLLLGPRDDARWRSRRVAGAPERPRAHDRRRPPLRRAHPTAGIHVFRGDQDLRVPVPEPSPRSPRRRRLSQIPRALDRRPRERHGRRLHVRRHRAPRHGPLARVRRASSLLDWELNPEFDLRILGREGARRPGAIRMRPPAWRMGSGGSAERLPPGFADMSIWSDIDAELYVARGTGGVDGGGAVRGTTAVCADLSIRIAADIPGRAPRRALLQKNRRDGRSPRR